MIRIDDRDSSFRCWWAIVWRNEFALERGKKRGRIFPTDRARPQSLRRIHARRLMHIGKDSPQVISAVRTRLTTPLQTVDATGRDTLHNFPGSGFCCARSCCPDSEYQPVTNEFGINFYCCQYLFSARWGLCDAWEVSPVGEARQYLQRWWCTLPRE